MGLTRIPRKSKQSVSPGAIESDRYRSSVMKHLRLSDLDENIDNFVAFSHWHPRVLEEHHKNKKNSAGKMFPKVLCFELGREIGLLAHDRVPTAISSSSKYYINVPSATAEFYRTYLNTAFTDQQIANLASGESTVPVAIRRSLSASGSEETSEGLGLARLSSVRQRSSFIAAEILNEERKMKNEKNENKRKSDKESEITTLLNMTTDGQKLMKKSVSEVKLLKRKLEESMVTNRMLHEKKEDAEKELKRMSDMISDSIIRSNIVCPTWHESHPKFVPYWLGFISYSEFTIYHQCLWPDISTVVDVKDGYITEFEKSIITKMFFRKGLEFELIGHIWGRSNIGRYVKSWAPLWGEAGANLSILDINESILRSLTPEDFINGCTDKVCGLVDGKDFKTETIRTHSGITRAGHSNKVNCSALRVLSWVLNNGLNVERSEPYLGRASETHIVQVLGSHSGEVPIRQVDKVLYQEMKRTKLTRECSVRATVRNVGEMVAGVTRLHGEVMDGDEDQIVDGADSAHYCSRVDNWFEKMITSDEIGTLKERKKAKVYTTKDHDILEQAVLRAGPNKSPESKLIQLRCLHKIHAQFKSGNLESCLLSEYLDVTVKLRKDMVRVLKGRTLRGEDGIDLSLHEHNIRLSELRLPLRLGKFPRGWAILADRGFANDATRYPNMNVQMTPSFLSGRDQFTHSELSSDMVKCKLRYISETNFARVTDENLLTDVIPAHFLPYIKDCISWGHASANLCKKYKDRQYV